jgi:hypothetical protein
MEWGCRWLQWSHGPVMRTHCVLRCPLSTLFLLLYCKHLAGLKIAGICHTGKFQKVFPEWGVGLYRGLGLETANSSEELGRVQYSRQRTTHGMRDKVSSGGRHQLEYGTGDVCAVCSLSAQVESSESRLWQDVLDSLVKRKGTAGSWMSWWHR